MKLVLHSITHHNCPIEVREKPRFTPPQQCFMLKKMHDKSGIAKAVELINKMFLSQGKRN